MFLGVNHIGFAVNSIDKTLEMLSAFGAKELGRRSFPQMGQTSCLVQLGDSKYELMEPFGKDGVVSKFLEKNREGFHHISLVTDDLEGDCDKLEASGIKLVMRLADAAFTHPASTGGVVYELTNRRD